MVKTTTKKQSHLFLQAPIVNTLNTVKESNGSDRPDQLYRDF